MGNYYHNILRNFKVYNLNRGIEIKKILSTQRIDSAWWSRFLNSKIDLSFYRFLELCFIFNIPPEQLILSPDKFKEIIISHELPNYNDKVDFKKDVLEYILKSKKILKNKFKNSGCQKNTFFINNLNTEQILCPRTLKRVFDYEYHIHFKLKTLFLILEVLGIDLECFFKNLGGKEC